MTVSTCAADSSLDALHLGFGERFSSMQETLKPLRIAREELFGDRRTAGETCIHFDDAHQCVALGIPASLPSTPRPTIAFAFCSERGAG